MRREFFRCGMVVLLGVVGAGCPGPEPPAADLSAPPDLAIPPPGPDLSRPPACHGNADCVAVTDYCAMAMGPCQGAGECAARPAGCTKEYDPVCGCDGNTYGNACAAAMAGVNVRARGVCGQPCTADKDCSAGQVCELGTGCSPPMYCVAGCHADTDCGPSERCKQVQCLTCPCPGVCEVLPGCRTNAECKPDTEYCAKGTADCACSGKCATRAQVCPMYYDPVCGCDGRTYGNECAAASAGVNVQAKGPCKIICTVDQECAPGMVCELGTGCRKPMYCVTGCHANTDCAPGLTCHVVQCLTCPCPGVCN